MEIKGNEDCEEGEDLSQGGWKGLAMGYRERNG